VPLLIKTHKIMANLTFNTFELSDLEKAFNKAFERAIKEFINPPKQTDKDLKSRKETARILSISLPTLHLFTKEGIIRAYRIGNRVLYKQEDIENALKIIVPPNQRGRSNGN
jgi:excisionase family DNA binding protein